MTRRPRSRTCHLVATVLTALAMTLGLSLAAVSPAAAATPVPAVPTGLPAGIEALARYVPVKACDLRAKPGTVALAKLLTTTYPSTRYGLSRACGTRPDSEHYDGRAIDWMTNVRDPQQAAQATALLSWLFATDRAGNPYANARRLGIMYVIWNNKIWGAYSADGGWRAYSSCATHPEQSWDSTCHRDHVHISLSWEGAMGRTSFWSKQVAAPDFGPCRAVDLNWAPYYKAPRAVPCPSYPRVYPPSGASATLVTLTTYSGMTLRLGATGPAVRVVQQVIGVTVTGYYGTTTKETMIKWQEARGLRASGNANSETWRALLKSQAPR